MPLWCSRCDSAYTNCAFFGALLPCSLFQCASLFVSVLPTLSCLFAHFCFGRMRVADGVSIDLSKWDNSHGSATNKNEGACRENKRSMAGAQQNKQWRKLRQLIMPFSKTTCTAHSFALLSSFSLVCMRSASKRRHVHMLLLLRAILTTFTLAPTLVGLTVVIRICG